MVLGDGNVVFTKGRLGSFGNARAQTENITWLGLAKENCILIALWEALALNWAG